MTKDELKTGMIVTLRNGYKYVVLLNCECGNVLKRLNQYGYMNLDNYDINMILAPEKRNNPNIPKADKAVIDAFMAQFDIASVYSCKHMSSMIDFEHYKLCWTREK